MVENKLNLKFFPNIPCYNHIDKGIIYSFKIPHAVQLKDIVLHLDYEDYKQTMKTLKDMNNLFNIHDVPKDFDELVERLMKYKNDYNYHPQVDKLSLFNRIEIRSDNLNCMIGFPMDKFVNNKISLDKILPLPPETITVNTEIKLCRNADDYKCKDLYITVDNLYYDCDEPDFDKLPEIEKYKKYPRGNVWINKDLNKNYKHYKTNDSLCVLMKNTNINTEISKDIKEIYLVYKNEILGTRFNSFGIENINDCFRNLKVYIDYKLTDITTFTELFDYLKQHKTTFVNIVFDDNLPDNCFENYYIYYKAVMN